MSYTEYILQAGYIAGYIIIFSIVFAESGLLIGFFLPGDSFLFTLGLLAAQGKLDLLLLMLVAMAGAILGDSLGYATGRKFGPSLFKRPDSRIFKKENLEKAQEFYAKHGKKTIVLARFVPFVRSFAPIIAGIAKMNYSTFLFYNVIGGVFWVMSLALLGYSLGNVIPDIDHYILPIIAVIVLVSVIPAISHFKPRKK